jgi:hypothetical protein
MLATKAQTESYEIDPPQVPHDFRSASHTLLAMFL